MQKGLNIGVGSWIHKNHGSGCLPLLSSDMPIPFQLKHHSLCQTAEEFVLASEFSLIANRTGDHTRFLWDKYRGIVSNMESPISTLTRQERDNLTNARAVLFSSDGYSPSQKYILYEEYKRAFEDITISDASPEDATSALEQWMIYGHKNEIESAKAIILNLNNKSSLVVANEDITKIDNSLYSSGSDTPHVPTTFFPLSAQDPANWNEAEVDLQELEEAINTPDLRNSWARYRQRKDGKIKFRYTAIDVVRPWFSATIFDADDWRFASGNSQAASDGAGGGLLPDYIHKVYLATVTNVKYKPRPTKILYKPGSANIGKYATISKKYFVSKKSTKKPRKKTHLLTRNQGHLTPIKSTNSALSSSLSGTVKVAPKQKILQRIQYATIAFTPNNSVVALHQSPPEQNSTTYIVGYGKSIIPSSPNPNGYYQWP